LGEQGGVEAELYGIGVPESLEGFQFPANGGQGVRISTVGICGRKSMIQFLIYA
jgi:hypothetical protein